MARTTIHPSQSDFMQALKSAKAEPGNYVQPVGNPQTGEVDMFVERDPEHDHEVHAIHQLAKL